MTANAPEKGIEIAGEIQDSEKQQTLAPRLRRGWEDIRTIKELKSFA